MAQNFTDRIPANQNVLQETAFMVSIERMPAVEFFSDSVDMPDVSLGVVEVMNPNSTDGVPGDQLTFGDLGITFKLDEDLVAYTEIYEWMKGLGFPESQDEFEALMARDGIARGEDLRSDISVIINTNGALANKKFTFHDCFPTNLAGFQLTSKSTEAAGLAITVAFKFSGAFEIT